MPRPFRFSLERVLDLRRQQEEQAHIQLAQAERQLQQQRAEADRLESELSRAGGELTGRRELAPDELWLWRSYQERILLEIHRAEQAWQELASKVNECRKQALERSKERRKLEKLKENQAQEHKLREEYQEQQVLDEMATLRHTKRFF